ncbi:MAG: response regulator [Opitutaceae bacterium]|jgi:CheY-like chemotaxis protein
MNPSSTILVVDDIAANRETLRELLDPENCRLVEAADGKTALRMAAESPPDLVLLDVMMPGMDGFEVCRKLRADTRLAEVPVIMVTALDDQASRLAGLEAGADDFVTKPFNRFELRARVRTITRLNRYRRLHEAQAALQASETRFRALFDLGPVAVYTCDTSGKILEYNLRAVELWGRKPKPGDPADQYCDTRKLYLPDGTLVSREPCSMARVANGSVPMERDVETIIERPDGTRLTTLVNIAPLRNDRGEITGAINCVNDITERKRLDAHFLQAQKMEALGQFSGGVAHDFNNILAAIGGYAELSQLKLQDNPEVREYLAAVLQATRRAAALVRQILAFSRQLPEDRQVIDLRPVVAESLKLLRATIPATIEFDQVLATDAPTVFANAGQIHQVLMNLGINAWHAIKGRPGRLQIKLERCVVDAAHAATQPRLREGLYARISVSDSGTGMDDATLRRIFEPFFTTKPTGEGTGLGLAVVHGIMENHDGAVTVYSQPGEGTVFHLYFPANNGETSVAETEEKPAPYGHGERILVVDDEQLLAQLGQKSLIALGYEAEIATRPEDAIARVRADPQRFALVLTDRTMPGMTGLMLADQLRAIRPGLPIIMTTGYVGVITPEQIAAAGISQILIKPTSLQSLGTAVHAALSIRKEN